MKLIFQLLIFFLFAKLCNAQIKVIDVDKNGLVVDTTLVPYDQGKIFHLPEVIDKEDGKDTIEIISNGKNYFIIREIENRMKKRISKYDESWNLIEIKDFDNHGVSASKLFYKNGSLKFNYNKTNKFQTYTQYYKNGSICYIHIVDSLDMPLHEMSFDSLGRLLHTSRHVKELNQNHNELYDTLGNIWLEFYLGNSPGKYFTYYKNGQVKTEGNVFAVQFGILENGMIIMKMATLRKNIFTMNLSLI